MNYLKLDQLKCNLKELGNEYDIIESKGYPVNSYRITYTLNGVENISEPMLLSETICFMKGVKFQKLIRG